MAFTSTDFSTLLQCSRCTSKLVKEEKKFLCDECGEKQPIVDGRLTFTDCNQSGKVDAEFQQDLMYNKTIVAKLFNFGSSIVSSDYKPDNQLDRFMKQVKSTDVVIELGSGNRRLSDRVVNIDLFPFQNVDITSDISKIPFADNSVDYIIIDNVLEHIAEPGVVIAEVHRVLKHSGKAICICPFILPYHGYPNHYYNYTKDGLEYLFKAFSNCSVEMNTGPTSALTNLISEYFALAFSGDNKMLYTMIKGVVLLPIFYLKLLDKLWVKNRNSTRMASILSAIVTK